MIEIRRQSARVGMDLNGARPGLEDDPAPRRSKRQGILSQLEPPAGVVDFSKVIAQRLQDVLSAADIQ